MKKYFLLGILIFLFGDFSFAQDAPKYRRSSLHMMMTENPSMPNKEVIGSAFLNSPFPDKYDNLNYNVRSAGTVMNMEVTERTKEEIKEMPKEERKKFKKIGSNDRKLNKYFHTSRIGNELIAKWFNRSNDGSFDMSVIADRGEYNASELDVQKAETQSRSVSTQLADAGLELISSTFVVVNDFDFRDNETEALIAYELAKIVAESLPNESPLFLQRGALKKAKDLYEKARQGYTVETDCYLYQLDWSDSVQAIFYNDYWVDESTTPEEREKRVKLFNESNLFQLKFIDMQNFKRVVSNVKLTDIIITSKSLTQEEILSQATVRAMDRAFSRLQRENEVFKPKVPLYQAEGKRCSAKIGLKESLEGGEKFEVLEQTIDKKTGKTIYKRIGTLKVNKKKIWDNMFYVRDNDADASKDVEDVVKKKIDDEPLEATWFKKCKKKYYPGMLIRQMK